MSSTTQSELLDEIKTLFSWNPPCLIPTTNKKSSTSTARLPSFYDKHFSSKLVLKRVERLPSLVQDLAKNVDKSLNAALATLPPLNGLITAQQREDEIELLTKRVPDEYAVANFYRMTTGKYCAQVASTLALHPSASTSRWRSLLCWTQSSTPRSSYGIMDGLLCFIEKRDGNQNQANILESMESKNRRIFEEMEKYASALATWEMKSTSAGSAEVMNAVRNLGKFAWTFCNRSGYCRSINPDHLKARADVAKVRVGLDAKTPLWSLPDDSLNTSLDPENHDEGTDIQPLASTSSATLQTLPPPQSSALRSSEHESPMKVQGKKRKRDDEAYQNQHDKTAQSLVQQAWAQAVKVDGTLIVLHSGNHELVCVRHRDSQTLYISDVIEPPTCVKPGYGKLHVGIYVAAVQDAMDRWKEKPPGNQDQDKDDQDRNQGSISGRKRGAGPGSIRRAGHRGRHRGIHGVGERKMDEFQRSTGRKNPTDELLAIERTIHVASNRDMVLLYLRYDVYDSPIPASFLRSAPSFMPHTACPTTSSPRAIRTYGLEECLTIVLTSEIGRGATGMVHRGTLELEISYGTMPLDVVVKLTFDTGQRDALRSEYDVYRRLRSKGILQGIATVLGLFDDSEDGACALVMLYAGVPLVEKQQRSLSDSNRKSALSTLECIHRAGILHGDIRQDNILMGDSGITIIDFGHSEECDDQEAKDKEFARLRYLLGLSRESQ